TAWRPFLPDAVFLCIFREPARTAHSIIKECQTADYLAELPMDFRQAVDVWTLMYRHIVEVHRHRGHWLFFHYNQLCSGEAFATLAASLGVPVDRDFPDRALRRSAMEGTITPAALELYGQLCELAGYRNEQDSRPKD